MNRFREFHRRRSLRFSAAKGLILQAALERGGHFDLGALLIDLRRQGVSRATVYRALPLLIEAGILQPTVVSGQTRRFESAFGRGHHDHLICAGCGKIVEFQFEAFEVLQQEVASRHGFELTAHVHELIGLCSACRGSRRVGGRSAGSPPGGDPPS